MTLVLLAACSSSDSAEEKSPVGTADGQDGLELVLDQDDVVAGTAIGWSAIVHHPDGSTEAVAAELSSDLEAELRLSDDTVTPVLAGEHSLSASWESLSAVGWVRVSPGPAASLELGLSATQTPAGTPLSMSLSGWDRYGNVVDTSAAAYTTDDAAAIVAAPNVVSTVPGSYSVTATLDEVSDSQGFRVVAGEPVGLELSLSKTELELYETTLARIAVVDVYGNEVDVDADLWVEGDGEVEVAAESITFYDEGSYYVYAAYGELDDLVGPILVDSTGPTLVVEEPERGAWVRGSGGTVSGSCEEPYSSLEELTVNGEPVEVADDGSFSTSVAYDFGLNIVETAATDSDGNRTVDTRAVLAGEFWPYGDSLTDGIVARLNQDGFDEIEVLGESLINGTDLAALVPSPAYETSSESCVDVIFDEVCITWYGITLYLTNPSIGGSDLELDPTSAGTIDATFTVYTPSIDWEADGTVLGIDMSADGNIYADNITIALSLQPYVSGGELGVNVVSAAMSTAGFSFDWDSWIYDVMDFFGLDLSGLVEGYLSDAVEGLMTDEIPSMLADVVGDLEISMPIELGEDVFQLDAVPSSVSVDDLGLTLGLGTLFTTASWDHAETGLGSLWAGYSLPVYSSASPDLQLSVSLDFVNELLYAFWGSGVLDISMSSSELGLDLSSVGDYLGFTELNIVVYPELPPVVVPGSGAMGELQIGDLEIVIYDGPVDPANVAYDVYASVFADFDLSASDGMLAPSIGDPVVWFDVVTPANNTEYSEDVETLLAALIPMLLPELTGALETIPLPDIEGFPLAIDSIYSDGGGGWVTIDGDLELESLDELPF